MLSELPLEGQCALNDTAQDHPQRAQDRLWDGTHTTHRSVGTMGPGEDFSTMLLHPVARERLHVRTGVICGICVRALGQKSKAKT